MFCSKEKHPPPRCVGDCGLHTGAHFRVVAKIVEDLDAQRTGRVLREEGPNLSDQGMEPTPPHQEFPRSGKPKRKKRCVSWEHHISITSKSVASHVTAKPTNEKDAATKRT